MAMSRFSESPDFTEESGSLNKTKPSFYSVWNSFKFEFQKKFRTKFNFDTPICLLGQFYHIKMFDSVNLSDKKPSSAYVYENFKQDFYSRIWMTYRKEFPQIMNSNLTSDAGWGCMIRSGQMILAQALLTHFLGRNWRWKGDKDDMIHRMIIKWFADNPNPIPSPFSIHEIVRAGQRIGKKPGDWFGPASISLILKHVLDDAVCTHHKLLNDISCYVAQDCTVYLKEIIKLCSVGASELSTKGGAEQRCQWRSVIVLIPLRLGGDRFNPTYASYLKELLSMPSCLGIIGGKPRHSLYFVGFQDDKLLYIDPHYCQPNIDVTRNDFSLESYHCHSPRKISIHSIDPSCTVGFYFKSKDQLEEFVTCTNQLLEHAYKIGSYPLFTVSEGESDQYQQSHSNAPDQLLQMQYRVVDSRGNVQKVIRSEEFVLL